MRRPQILLAFTIITAQAVATEQSSKFDGKWSVTLACPAHIEQDQSLNAVGYTHRFSGQITNGQLRAMHGIEGKPDWHLLTGAIAEDGSVRLLLEGIVGPQGGINRAPVGRYYRYPVQAQFEPSSGSGERLTGRICHFTFSREPLK